MKYCIVRHVGVWSTRISRFVDDAAKPLTALAQVACVCAFFVFCCLYCVRVSYPQKFLFAAGELAQDKPVVVSKFILNAKEIEFDGVAHDGKILNYAISEHVEVCLTNHRIAVAGVVLMSCLAVLE